MKYDRNGTDYFVLGTTGAGMAHQGPLAGEFDEIVWVTLAKDGPPLRQLDAGRHPGQERAHRSVGETDRPPC